MELGQAFRGEHAEIMSFVSGTVNSELSGNMIDLCPVGALTANRSATARVPGNYHGASQSARTTAWGLI